ncbi:MAG: UDP-N-acetylmuramoyl-tripeptide--D-alanyl-D-alanine ligase [Legionella sp.]|nr:UDP-N-acetylmuramoyl-tripeptide--D-alanyl-D-alanine ligase [Legionella sp.]
MMNLQIIAQQLECQIRGQVTDSDFITSICIDSRKVQSGALFVALRGEHFDGHDFIATAVSQGAIAVICERPDSQIGAIPQLIVSDTLKALTNLAVFHRQNITCPVIALTGSNGKTTVKEMIASILPKPSFATFGNLNNHIGVPLSVLQLKTDHRYAVFELGANHLHEIAHTVAIVQPKIALINNIAPAHIEGFGSLEGVARAKGEIYEGLTANGTAIINEDDDFAHFWDDLVKNKQVIRFSLTKPADVHARDIHFNDRGCASFHLVLPTGTVEIQLQVPGEHSVRNALAASSACFAAGIALGDIAKGLNDFQGVAGRLTYLSGKNQSLVIDDTYNANLRSVVTAVNVLAKRQGRRILVLGDMGELGAWTKEHHEEIGRFAQSQGIDLLMTCGKHSEFSSQAFGDAAHHFASQEELAQDLLPRLNKDTTVLVKGSRSAQMEKIVHQLVG